MARINEPLPPPSYVHATSQAELATLIIDIVRPLVTLADTLKSDLTQSVLGVMSEAQLATFILQQARTRERELVLDMWGGSENVRVAWAKWVSSKEAADSSPAEEREAKVRRRKMWVAKLIETLALPVPVSCDVPPSVTVSSADFQTLSSTPTTIEQSPTRNELPPQFFFIAPTLFYLQNCLQALVVTGSLRSLTRIPSPPRIPSSDPELPPEGNFMSRVWTLLKAEINRDEFAIGVGASGRNHDEQEDPTKIINLADEVVRARRLYSGTVTEQEEKSLRDAVERTLRPRDPVFSLLLERVVRAVESGIVGWIDGDSTGDKTIHSGIPEKMRTGRGIGTRGSYGVHHTVDREHDKKWTEPPKLKLSISVKGFEDPVLAEGIEDLFTKVIHCVQWTEDVWGDLL